MTARNSNAEALATESLELPAWSDSTPVARAPRARAPHSWDVVPWWTRPRLRYEGDALVFAGVRVDQLVAQHGSPLLAYDRQRIQDNVGRVTTAFAAQDHPFRLYFAVKANRFEPVLEALRATDRCGIDCSSPGEVRLALANGFDPSEISFTASCVSEADADFIAPLPIRINVDSISMMHKIGQRAPGRSVGIRVNPRIGVGMTGQLTYAGAKPSKFGIYPDRFDEALKVAQQYGLRVEGIHMHVGSAWLARGLETFTRAVDRLVAMARQLPRLRYINVGGGIGVPHAASDEPVDLSCYAASIVRRVRTEIGPDIEICAEPGDYLVNDAGILAATVTMVEEKGGETFVGLDVGFNAHPQAAHYEFVQEIVHAHRGPARPRDPRYLVVGNINEVIDVFHPAATLPDVREGDVLTMLNAGGYGSSMASYHCLREPAREIAI